MRQPLMPLLKYYADAPNSDDDHKSADSAGGKNKAW